MIEGIPWDAVGAIAGALAVVLAVWQVHLARVKRSSDEFQDSPTPHTSNAPPLGRLPRVRGRDDLLDELERSFESGGKAQILVGLGGIGKTAIALELCSRVLCRRRFRRPRTAWWIPATDEIALTSGMLSIARQVGATQQDLLAIEQGNPSAIHRFWELLEEAKFRWLLVLDNADIPSILANREYASRVSDGTGWVRASQQGLVVVTSRITDPSVWGTQCDVRVVQLPNDEDCTQILFDIAADGGTVEDALSLVTRLGNLPLALYLAAGVVSSSYSSTRTFLGLLRKLEETGPDLLTPGSDFGETGPTVRNNILKTWELTLDSLTPALPASRFLLRIIACFAPATPIPVDVFNNATMRAKFVELFPATHEFANELIVDRHLNGLVRTGLIDLQIGQGSECQVIVHSLVAETCRIYTAADIDHGWRRSDVYSAAANLLHTQAAALPGDEPCYWSIWRKLIPHLRSVIVASAGYISREQVHQLLISVQNAVDFLWWSGDARSGEELAESSLNKLEAHADDMALVLGLRGAIVLARGRIGGWSANEEILQQLVSEGVRAGLGDKPEVLRLRQEWANCMRENGKLDQAEQEMRAVYRRRSRVLGPENRATLDSLHELCRTVAKAGRHSEALVILRKVVDVRRYNLGSDHPRTLAARHEVASAMSYASMLAESKIEMRDVLQRRTSVLGPKHTGTIETRQELARITGEMGDMESSINELVTVQKLWVEVLGSEHPSTLAAFHELGCMLERGGRLREAEESFLRAMQGRRRTLGTEHPQSVDSTAAHAAVRQRISAGHE